MSDQAPAAKTVDEAPRKAIGPLLQAAARAHRTFLTRKLATVGLYAGQEPFLLSLRDQTALTMGDLARAHGLSPATVSKSITRMGVQGLLTQTPDAKDGRQIRVTLTATGRKAADALAKLLDSAEEEFLASLDDKDRRRLRKALRRLSRSADDA